MKGSDIEWCEVIGVLLAVNLVVLFAWFAMWVVTRRSKEDE